MLGEMSYGKKNSVCFLCLTVVLKSTLPVLVMTISMSVPICKRFHASKSIAKKSPLFKGIPKFDTRVRQSH